MRRMTAGPVSLIGLLLVAGCGQAERPYRPGEAPVPATSEVKAAPATSRPPATIDVGGDLKVRVEWPARNDALVRLFPDYYAESWQAVVSGGDRYLRHVEPTLVGEAAEWVRDFTGRQRSVSGVARLFRLRVKAVVGKGAELTVCVDETKMRVISTGTGEAVTPQPASSRAPYLQIVLAHRGDDGVWRIRQFRNSKEGCS
ncbi:hypothetical protein [Nonomuraea sp. LPB2021202275-12-8]|uniref:hypothetical protein n=1 Tax=Nonomuraea sp. LPB2021202275-12-8 TaxID=3120159 RepID=UPI00300C6D9D